MNEKTTRAIGKDLLQFMATRKLAPLIALFADKVDWEVPGNQKKVPWVGRRTTKSEIMEFYQLLWDHTEPLSADMDSLVTDGQHVIIIGSFKTKMLATNKTVNSFFCIHATVENSLLVRYRLFEDTFAVSETLTG